MRRVTVALTIVALALATAACSGHHAKAPAAPAASSQVPKAIKLPKGSEPVQLDPAQFSSQIDNPYWPMAPGSRWVYRETDGQGGQQRIEVTVTNQTKKIMGIEARVVHDVASEGGQVVEDTFDWYAQDAQGNLWYMGEGTKEFENGKFKSAAGSWQAGVKGAQPGIVIPAAPKPGLAYRQEYLKGQAEDNAAVISIAKQATVPFGSFSGMLQTKETTPLEPGVVEQKFYARGVGQVLALTTSGGSDREELLSYVQGS